MALTRKSAGRAPLCNWAASSSACARVKFPVIWALPPGIGPSVCGAVTTFPSKTTAIVSVPLEIQAEALTLRGIFADTKDVGDDGLD